ncbi:unnamed protein product [Ectocarpus sp. 6 AP-2014]
MLCHTVLPTNSHKTHAMYKKNKKLNVFPRAFKNTKVTFASNERSLLRTLRGSLQPCYTFNPDCRAERGVFGGNSFYSLAPRNSQMLPGDQPRYYPIVAQQQSQE